MSIAVNLSDNILQTQKISSTPSFYLQKATILIFRAPFYYKKEEKRKKNRKLRRLLTARYSRVVTLTRRALNFLGK